MATVTVARTSDAVFEVRVDEGGSQTTHRVTATPEVVRRYGGDATAERLIEESFRFLLEREPKESILRSFDLPVIERYFPEYPREIAGRV